MAPDNWEHPYEPIDEWTAHRECLRAEERVQTAATGEARTLEAVSSLRAVIAEVRVMHEENHYAQRLLPLFRGSTRHAS